MNTCCTSLTHVSLAIWLTLLSQKAISANSFVFLCLLLLPPSLTPYHRIGRNMFTGTFVNFQLNTHILRSDTDAVFLDLDV